MPLACLLDTGYVRDLRSTLLANFTRSGKAATVSGHPSEHQDPSRRSILRRGLLLGTGAVAAGAGLVAATGSAAVAQPGPALAHLGEQRTAAAAAPGGQYEWRYCSRCKGMYYNGQQAGNGVCPAGGAHNPNLSGDYYLLHDHSADSTAQNGWAYCRKCHGLAWGGSPGVCPAPGRGHDYTDSFVYDPWIVQSADGGRQAGWKHCKNCQGLHYAVVVDQSVCPHGGPHVTTGSADYFINLF
jgi:hypothetical protein